ncbi:MULTISPECIES: RluA family pseudouridine synthase [Bacillaceae]|uniref:Pseudouridine synthase n=1 Tax=Evansella alkalicola TaxID=745819 RepID=A0ABS6K228_9BACI|nr:MULTISPECIES: RluA family pseudouridine synthase [Bacillaceae]MBU9723627.1 RluA family pseudouridine synthase [Bacillus alkalicola]
MKPLNKLLTMTWTVSNSEEGLVLREFLRARKQLSRKTLADIKYGGGNIEVNDAPVTVRHLLKKGDIVKITFPAENVSGVIQPFYLHLDIVHEDNHLLIVNKPPHLPTVPSIHNEHSLAGAVLFYYQQCGIPSTFHAINRLDKDTSGLLMIAKHRYAHDQFVRMQNKGEIKRTYRALVHGQLTVESGTIDSPIGRKDGSIIERVVRPDGQRAVTHFQIINVYHNTSLVELTLETGRTHQIRVHMSHLGHPLIADTLYGGIREGLSRQGLHASRLDIYHPIVERYFTFETNLPTDMLGYIAQCNS